MAEYSVQQTVAASCTDLLLSVRVTLPTPAWEVTGVQKTVLIDRADATLGSVLLQGRLRACYAVAGVPCPATPPSPGALPAAGTTLFHAPLLAVWAESPFTTAIAVAGAEPGLTLTVTAAHVTDQSIHPELDRAGAIGALFDQSLLRLAIRLSRTRTLPAPEPPHPPTPPAFTRFQSPRRT